MHPVQSIGYAAAYPAYPLNLPLLKESITLTTIDNPQTACIDFLIIDTKEKYISLFIYEIVHKLKNKTIHRTSRKTRKEQTTVTPTMSIVLQDTIYD